MLCIKGVWIFMWDRLNGIRDMLENYQGCLVRLHAVGERNKVVDTMGILEGVYPRVFVVRVQQGAHCTRYCYTYREILTDHVRVSPALVMG